MAKKDKTARKTADAEVKAAIKRVMKERDELQTKLSALCAFMDTRFEGCKYLELSPGNRILLDKQRVVMMRYRDILDVRIELMTGELGK